MLEQVARADGFASSLPVIDEQIGDGETELAEKWLIIAGHFADDFQCQPVHDRIAIMRKRLRQGISHRDLGTEFRVLRETIDNGLKNQSIYRYPAENAKVFGRWKDDWQKVLLAFPSSQKDVLFVVWIYGLSITRLPAFSILCVC
jgi:hypothetical protein